MKFTQSYGASGDQARAVESGLPADIVALSLAPDVDKLVEPGIVDANWADNDTEGFVTNSVVVFAVRKGNPKNIKTWDDLIKKGVEVITPNPFTSGGAKWNLMAAYGAQLEQGKSEEEALDYLKKLPAEHAGPGQVGPRGARHLLRRQGRRADLLRERGDHRAEGRRRPRLRDPGRDDPDPEPGRGHQGGQVAREGQGVPGLPQDARGAEDLRRPRATGASSPSRSTSRPTRTRRSSSRSTSSAAGTRSTPSSSTRRRGSVAKIEQDLGVSTAK